MRAALVIKQHQDLQFLLIDEQFAVGFGAAGTRIAERPSPSSTPDWLPEAPPRPDLFHDSGTVPLAFQMGVPYQDAFPFKLWSRILTREARRAAAAPVGYPDPLSAFGKSAAVPPMTEMGAVPS
jgi:hypothetical protein